MNIIRLAAGRMVHIRATVDYKTGEVDTRVVGNPNGEGCSSTTDEPFNEKLINDLMETEVAGFGEMEILDSGLTEQGFAEKMKKRTKPLPTNPLQDPNAPKIIPGKPQQEQQQLDPVGLGV